MSAVQNVIKNAILTIAGSTSYIGITAYKDSQGVTLQTLVKHNPSTTWYGIKPSDGYVEYYNQTTGFTLASTQTTASKTQAVYYDEVGFTLPCSGTTTVTVPNQQNGAVGWNTSAIDFNSIGASPTYSHTPITYSLEGDTTCGNGTLTATATTPYNFTLQILNPADEVIASSTTSPLSVAISTAEMGEYTAVLTLSTGCSFEDTYEVL